MKILTHLQLAAEYLANKKYTYLYKRQSKKNKVIFLYSGFLSAKKKDSFLFGKIKKLDNLELPICFLTDIHTAYKDLEAWLGRRPIDSKPLNEFFEQKNTTLVISNNKEKENLLLYIILRQFVICFKHVTQVKEEMLSQLIACNNENFIVFENLKELDKFLNEEPHNERLQKIQPEH